MLSDNAITHPQDRALRRRPYMKAKIFSQQIDKGVALPLTSTQTPKKRGAG